MCHFITATLPGSVDQSQVAAIFERHKIGFKELANPHLATQLRAGELNVLTTRGHCDCGTVLGSLNRFDLGEPVNHDHELERLRKRGWRQAKIERWLEEKGRAREKGLREEEARAEAGRRQAAEWVAFIGDLLRSGRTSSIGLLLHQYQGNIESERIKLIGRKTIKLEALTSKVLMQMEEDILYEFVA